MSITYNNFKSTTVRGVFNNSDYADGSVLASGTFDRDLTVKGNLTIGNETVSQDASGNNIYTDTGGNIIFKLNNITYTITPSLLKSCLLSNAFTGTNMTITNSTNSRTLYLNQDIIMQL